MAAASGAVSAYRIHHDDLWGTDGWSGSGRMEYVAAAECGLRKIAFNDPLVVRWDDRAIGSLHLDTSLFPWAGTAVFRFAARNSRSTRVGTLPLLSLLRR